MRSIILTVIKCAAATAALAFGSAISVQALNNGLGLTPQMGWNSWNHFGCNLHETLVHDTADAMISLGLAKAGYQYVNLDDCWALAREKNTSRIVSDPASFPSGMFALGEYIHSKGLKFGVYSDAGEKTCAGRPGSLGFEAIDALTYAAWGVDYLKYDNCFASTHPIDRYPAMRDALNWTGRPIFFSMCEWGVDDPATWATPIGNSWRTTNDITNDWNDVMLNLHANDRWAEYAGPGHWNDPDMLEVGNRGMTQDEEVSHFSLWALVKAPLIIGADLTNIPAASLNILLNPEVIAINQDPLGVQGSLADKTADGGEIWTGPLAGGSWAVVLLNYNGTGLLTLNAAWTLFGWPADTKAYVRDLWTHQTMGPFLNYSVTLARHASATLRVIPAHQKQSSYPILTQ